MRAVVYLLLFVVTSGISRGGADAQEAETKTQAASRESEPIQVEPSFAGKTALFHNETFDSVFGTQSENRNTAVQTGLSLSLS
jgi:hypothetical protein